MNDIQKARDVLAKWRGSATPGPWLVHQDKYAIDDEYDVVVEDQNSYEGFRPIRSDGSYAEYAGSMSQADAHLIVGTAGNPELLDAIDELLALYVQYPGEWPTPSVERIAAAIIAADERMSS